MSCVHLPKLRVGVSMIGLTHELMTFKTLVSPSLAMFLRYALIRFKPVMPHRTSLQRVSFGRGFEGLRIRWFYLVTDQGGIACLSQNMRRTFGISAVTKELSHTGVCRYMNQPGADER